MQSLLNRLEQLKSAQTAAQGLVDIFQSDTAAPSRQNATVQDIAVQGSQSLSPSPTTSSMTANDSFDVHCLIEVNGTLTSRFFGSSSTVVLAVELLAQTEMNGMLAPKGRTNLFLPTPNDIPNAYSRASYATLLQADALQPLIKIYLSSLNLIYPFIEESVVHDDLESVLIGQQPETPGSSILTGRPAHQYFRVMMFCANACAIKSRHEPQFISVGAAYYSEALRHVEEVTSEVSTESLQALLLLIVYCLFYPQKGDIWKLLDYACRLTVELGFHREEAEHIPDTIAPAEQQRELRRSCFWSLYTIERIVGQLFGRTSDLPEPIITTNYPTHNRPMQEDVMIQLLSATHHNRLVYLRSELYRHMYLPTKPPNESIEWYHGQYLTLLQWYHDLGLEKFDQGVGTITCTVAYHATIIFLFQPLVLRALCLRQASIGGERYDQIATMPTDNYYSACILIKTYEDVLQAHEDTELGAYPMTFMSAHYIYLAGLTIMAHCFLFLNEGVTTVAPWNNALHNLNTPGSIDFSELYKVTNSCLMLLTWCAEQWRGMNGMFDTFRRLSEALVPPMLRRIAASEQPRSL